uniref:Anaphase-promoting complex subunit 4 WD40 domain-containing protein n=1 Tax=Octactis speculum TaxID=3111310 RepID=A0A7S2GVY7_9STRA|mmetsp:Transcript_58585/g.79892  ORF Transcript_58585/g.79892 Transcript_58585/m.79892 type:complete len:499 (+) Transcript_58585:35-1531(+)|eukprot:CAMPEP_0185767158 /NCGR_PEP_ID=MMETSP1174-20130828/41784_1 /TAXON_ID=35687 /ORGANISM="Dictyocha speculum, Strain CCMP1381" /LENGTH=498 /DNA_ID=CAMNT_0028451219 /DNA_START=32 /DNA_END=1528 /DNA_ORIENTATION=-
MAKKKKRAHGQKEDGQPPKTSKPISTEEADLASELFGDPGRVLADEVIEQDLLEADGTGAAATSGKKRPKLDSGDTGETDEQPDAWEDDDDDNGASVDLSSVNRLRKLRQSVGETKVTEADLEARLRERVLATRGQAAWATLDADNSDTSAGASLLASTNSLQAPGRDDGTMFSPILGGELDVIRCKDANASAPARASVQALEFHPDGALLLAGGLDKTVRFFSVDGAKSQKVHSIFLPDCPVHSASWTRGGDEVIVSGRRPFFYVYDAINGDVRKVGKLAGRSDRSLEKAWASPDQKMVAFTANNGYVVLADARTKQWSQEFKINGTARSLSWSPCSRYLLASGGDAEVYTYDLRRSRCVSHWLNEGGTVTSAMACTDKVLAVASESGVVNIFDHAFPGPSSANPKPSRAVMNLTTPVETLTFNHDGQLLALASRWSKDSMRILHVPTRTVFSNWPSSKTPLSYVFSAAFSSRSGYMAIGNDKGKVLLYRLNHYLSV